MNALAEVVWRLPTLIRVYAGGRDPALREAVMLAVSRTNSCGPCTRVHERWALRAGLDPAALATVGPAGSGALDSRSRAAVSYATERARSGFQGELGSVVGGEIDEQLSPREVDAVEGAGPRDDIRQPHVEHAPAWPDGKD